MAKSKVLGYAWNGKSVLDGSPIVVVFNGLSNVSKNSKTGAMVQAWILRQDCDPITAQQTGRDASVCGDCKRRPILARENGEEECYVTVFRAPLAIWRAWKKGRYAPLPTDHDSLKSIFVGKVVRFGAYGDPAAVPTGLWASIIATGLGGHTGYTHQWRRPSAQPLKRFLMASVDSNAEAVEAQSSSWRTFRVASAGDFARMRNEISCPASQESAHRLTCIACKACAGDLFGKASVVIQAH